MSNETVTYDPHENALSQSQRLPEIINIFTTLIRDLDAETVRTHTTLDTASEKGLGAALLAPDVMTNLLPYLDKIERFSREVRDSIERIKRECVPKPPRFCPECHGYGSLYMRRNGVPCPSCDG